MKKVMSVLGLSLIMSISAFAQSNIAINSLAFVEKVKVENGKEIKVLEKASSVIPGETVVFKNIVENKNTTPAKDVIVNNIIPKEIAFVEAFSSNEKATQIEFSIDGVSFATAEKLLIKDTKTAVMRTARPEEYSNIRWIYNQNIPPKAQLEFNYKGILR